MGLKFLQNTSANQGSFPVSLLLKICSLFLFPSLLFRDEKPSFQKVSALNFCLLSQDLMRNGGVHQLEMFWLKVIHFWDQLLPLFFMWNRGINTEEMKLHCIVTAYVFQMYASWHRCSFTKFLLKKTVSMATISHLRPKTINFNLNWILSTCLDNSNKLQHI